MTDSTEKEIKARNGLPEHIQKQRQPCEVWQRVMGYMRPMSQWNIGKKSEGYSREYFNFDKTMASFAIVEANKDFCEKF